MLITNMVRGWKKISKNKNNNKKLTHQQSLTPRTSSFKPEAVMKPKKSSKEPTTFEGNSQIEATENMLPPLQGEGPASDGGEELPTTSKAAAATSDAPPTPPPAIALETSGLRAWKRIEKPTPIEEPPILSAKRNRAMRKRTSNWVKMASSPVVEIPLPLVSVVEPSSSSKCRPGTLYSDVLLTGGTLNRLAAAAQRGVGDQLEVADDNISVGGGALVASNLGFFPSLNALNKKPKAGSQQAGGQISSQAEQRDDGDEEDGTGRVAEADLLHLQMETLSLDSSLSRSGGLTDYEYFSAETDNDGWITSSGEVELEDSEVDSKSSDERSSSSHCPYEVVGAVAAAAVVAKGYAAVGGGGNDCNNNEVINEYADGSKLDLGYADIESLVQVDAACYPANVGQVVEVGNEDVVFGDGALVRVGEANTSYDLIGEENVTAYFSEANEAPSQGIGEETALEKSSSMGPRISNHVMLDIHPWNFLHLSDSSFIDFPRLLMQFSDPNYLRLEHQSMLGIKLAMGNMGGGCMPKH